MKEQVLILGIGGQDGSYLAEILLDRGFEVHGLCRRASTGNMERIKGLLDNVHIHQGDLLDPISLFRVISDVRPSIIYNEADQDNVGWSYDTAGYSYDVTGSAVGKILEIVRRVNPEIRFFQPVSATMFGGASPKQDESTPLDPQSPYACAKAMAYHLARYYRKTHGMFVSTGIFYNHDSPRRNNNYLLNKICRSAVEIEKGKQEKMELGNLDLLVDIGYAKEYMEAAYHIMQQEKPNDFVIATGQPYSIRALAEYALEFAGVTDVAGLIVSSKSFSRPGEEPILIGNSGKANKAFGFSPHYNARRVVGMLIAHLVFDDTVPRKVCNQ